MALVRCPSCGRVADGKMCFACGYEWPEGGAAATPSPSPAPSQAFKLAAPTSFPTAAVVAPTAPPALPQDDEIDLDVDFDEGNVDSSMPDEPPLSPTPGAFPPSFPPPSSTFGAPAPSSFPAPSSTFGAPAPSSFAPAFPAPSSSFPAPAFPSAGGSRVLGTFGSFPANSFGTSSSPAAPPAPTPPPAAPWAQRAVPAAIPADEPLPEIPAAPDPWAGAGPPPAAPSAALDSWVSPPGLASHGDDTVAIRAPSINFGSSPSWVSNPTVQVSASVADALIAGLAPAPSGAATRPPAGPATPSPLSGLFDGIETQHDAAPATVPSPSTFDDEGLNFTLEPGATIEPEPEPVRPSSSRGLGIEVAHDAASVPPPGAGVGVDGGFAELDALDLESNVDELVDVPSAEADLVDETFDIPEDAPDSEPATVAASATADEASFADVDYALEHDAPSSLDGEAAFDAFRIDGPGPPGVDVDDSLDALAELDRQIMSAASALATTAPSTLSPSLSERVGTLAESLEGEGRIGDAAMLYEVQAVLAGAGR